VIARGPDEQMAAAVARWNGHEHVTVNLVDSTTGAKELLVSTNYPEHKITNPLTAMGLTVEDLNTVECRLTFSRRMGSALGESNAPALSPAQQKQLLTAYAIHYVYQPEPEDSLLRRWAKLIVKLYTSQGYDYYIKNRYQPRLVGPTATGLTRPKKMPRTDTRSFVPREMPTCGLVSKAPSDDAIINRATSAYKKSREALERVQSIDEARGLTLSSDGDPLYGLVFEASELDADKFEECARGARRARHELDWT